MPSTVSHTKPTTELDDSDPTVATDVEDSGSIAATQVDCAESIPMTKVDCAAQDSMSPTNDVDCSDSIPAKVPAGIDSLPLEVLCQIFRSVVALNDFHVDKMGGLEVLQQVSTELAQAAISEPELWRWIYRDCTEPKPPVLSSNSAVALQEEASLNRKAAMDITHYTKLSGRLPLDLSLKLPSRSHYTELDILDLERSIVDRVWHLELPLSQSAALSLTSKEIRDPCNSDSDYLRGGSSDADVYGWPQLQELRLFFFPEDINFWVWRRRFGRHVGEGVRSSLRLMPRLTSLWLSMPKFPIGVNGSNMIMAAGFPLSQLTRLKLITTEPQQFSASLIMANACRANLEELWLRFNRPISSEIDAHQDPITFPNLKMLELFVCHEETFIASDDEGGLDLDLPRAFKLPSLEDLTIFFGASYEYSKERLKHQQGGMKVSTLLSLVPGNKLRTLYLSNISFEGDNEDLGDDPDDPYTHILSHSAFKNLETLALTDDFLPSFSFLRDKVDDCSFLPHLRDLAPEPGWLLPERQETFDAAYHQKEKFCKRRAQSPKKTAS
ncbi:hypothetical protein D9611_006708 [Ephemerocybe angulata]|uniref:Uncharacterized protein n=1 Tax=Ephemerocybe angulata TaxID=980116 RepID=A0A8H5C768_9AGAR|nr:hypothetical protein D9611_006708 [Tulosesus angulatus]